ncbi:MAG TPA: hypothetical protein VLF40_02665 [Candidatus Saccharimonadales bacterium]|nr:hypothetical protein [Candidatus Saccharimonadales bacterium]
MAIAFRSESHDIANGASGPVDPGEPAGAAQNDILVSLFMVTASSSYSLPAGWTSLYSGTSATSQYKYNLAYIVRGGSAPSTSWTYSGLPYHEVYIVAFSGCDTVHPINAQAQIASFQGVNTNPDPPSVTTTGFPAMILAIGTNWNGSASSWTAPSGYILQTDNSAHNDCTISTKTLSLPGSEDPGAYSGVSTGGSADIWAATIALNPASLSSVSSAWMYG